MSDGFAQRLQEQQQGKALDCNHGCRRARIDIMLHGRRARSRKVHAEVVSDLPESSGDGACSSRHSLTSLELQLQAHRGHREREVLLRIGAVCCRHAFNLEAARQH